MFKKKLSILLTTISILGLSTSIVSAKASTIVITGKDNKSYEYNYEDLKSSATANALGDTVNGALYKNFLQNKVSIAAYYDDVRNVYVSSSVVNQEAVGEAMKGKTFDFAAFLENANTASTSITATKVTKDNLINTGSTNDDSNVVTFKDKNLETVIRSTINKPTGDIYKNDVEKIIELKASSKVIKDISGIENLTNLKILDLSSNLISDISALKGLTNLQSVNLHMNQISDVSTLKGLASLEELDLQWNQISDISALKGLSNLQKLYLDNNRINDLSVFNGLTNLKILDLSANPISDISVLKNLTSLQELHLFGDSISSSNQQALEKALPNCNLGF